MILFEILQIFSGFFIAFSESSLKFENFEKKLSVMAQVFLQLLTPKDAFIYMHKMSCFWKLFGSELVNESLKLLISSEKYFYPTFSSIWVKLL